MLFAAGAMVPQLRAVVVPAACSVLGVVLGACPSPVAVAMSKTTKAVVAVPTIMVGVAAVAVAMPVAMASSVDAVGAAMHEAVVAGVQAASLMSPTLDKLGPDLGLNSMKERRKL